MSTFILFDGICNFCSSTVNFIMDRDSANYFKFAANQSTAAQELHTTYHLSITTVDTLILIEDGMVYNYSTAALRITKHLNGLWKLCYAFIVIPRPIRDAVYKFIAKNRYTWFGKKDACRMPTPEERARFL